MQVFTAIGRRRDDVPESIPYRTRDDDDSGSTAYQGDEIHLPRWVWDGVPTRHLVEELARRAGCQVVVDEVPEDDSGR